MEEMLIHRGGQLVSRRELDLIPVPMLSEAMSPSR